AEDGIRYWSVTGVQTCALPIYNRCSSQWRGQVGNGIDRRNQSKDSARFPQWSAGRTACDAGRGDVGGLAVRRAQTARAGTRGLQYAPQCLIERRQQERQGGCAQTVGAAARRTAARGLPRRKWVADAAGAARSYQVISKDLQRVMNRIK